jgi:hypothetical protein
VDGVDGVDGMDGVDGVDGVRALVSGNPTFHQPLSISDRGPVRLHSNVQRSSPLMRRCRRLIFRDNGF